MTWLEGRPEEGGRQHVRRSRGPGHGEAVTPDPVNVRSRVHEYGGGDYGFVGDELVFIDAARAGIQRSSGPVRGTLPEARYADLVGSPDGRWLVAVEEEPFEDAEPANRLVAFELATGERQVLVGGRDFVAQPVFSPDGARLACVAWDHPNLPWDGTELLVLPFGAKGVQGSARVVAGGPEESIFQPGFGPDGRLVYVTDRSGWWNLECATDAGPRPLCPMEAEFGRPLWVFGLSAWAFESAGRLLCLVGQNGADRLMRLDLERGSLDLIPVPFTELEGLRVEGRLATFLGASPEHGPSVCRYALDDDRLEVLSTAFGPELEALAPHWSRPEAIEFPSAGGRSAHAFFYPPARVGWAGPAGEKPPLLVKSHGGPTAATSSALRLPIQYWTTRGFAVVDVNYAGSTGYGRSYRNALRGQWGVADVDDCEAAARTLAEEGRVDPARLAITGGSAGGYTTLCALTFRDRFAAGASHYGIGDLETLARDTHKFESRYLDQLVGPYPEQRALYRERSPIHSSERLSCPVIFLQGLEDPIVPPNQAEAMVAALAARGIPHAYVTFEGEGHGFRIAANIQRALEAELAFYGQVLGFATPGVPPLALGPADGGAPALELGRG